jgi:hypothetical protein
MEMSPPIMMIPSTNMTNNTAQFAPVNVYTVPPMNPIPAVPANSLPNAEIELKQVRVFLQFHRLEIH